MAEQRTGLILVAVDGSRSAIIAAAVGARLARMLDARLGLVHVLDTPPLSYWAGIEDRMREDIRAQAERMLDEVSRNIAGACALTPSYFLVEGPRAEEICRLVRAHPETLMLIVGRHGVASEKGAPLSRAYSGELVRELAAELPVPLLLVPAEVDVSDICPGFSAPPEPDGAP